MGNLQAAKFDKFVTAIIRILTFTKNELFVSGDGITVVGYWRDKGKGKTSIFISLFYHFSLGILGLKRLCKNFNTIQGGVSFCFFMKEA